MSKETVPFNPKVSVIMNCLNGEKFLHLAIESVYSQIYQNWEIVFFDNASTDNTADIAKSFNKKVCYYRNTETVPLGQARNLALQKATGELIAFLDVDDSWLPDKLEKQIALFENAPSLGLVYSDTYLNNNETNRCSTYFAGRNYYPPKGAIFSSLLQNYSVPMLTVVIRKAVLDGLEQWFDESYQCCDDYDFILRIAYQWESNYVNEPLAKHLIHNEAVTVRLHSLAAKEKLNTLNKFCLRYSDFEDRYKSEIYMLRKQNAYMQAKSFWRDGNGYGARKELRKYIGSYKYLMTYIATLFPYNWIEYLFRRL